jgi:uncharacterized Zn finger protein
VKYIECEICGSDELDVIELQDRENKTIAFMFTCRECSMIFTKTAEK